MSRSLCTPRLVARLRAARKRLGPARGIAMLVVISSLAILISVAVEFRYQSSIDLQLAVNARDELRAEYLGRSAVNLSRLLLRFQKQVAGQSSALQSILGSGLGSMMQDSGLAGISFTPSIQLWKIVPVNEALFGILSGAVVANNSPLGSEPLHSFGDFTGSFSATIQEEETKFNVNRLQAGGMSGLAAITQALAMFGDPRVEFVFEEEDAHRIKMTPQDLVIALHDWIDPGDNQANLNATSASMPWLEGSGDENRNYSSAYPIRYRTKNAPFDSLDELYLVDGCSDLFMAAFRDRLTVYSDKNWGLNPNSDDPLQIYLGIVSAAANPSDPKLSINPPSVQIGLIFQNLSALKSLYSFFGGIPTSQFIKIIEDQGILIRPEVKARNNNDILTDKAETFTIQATGQVGDVEKKVTAVIRADSVLGKLMYYREE